MLIYSLGESNEIRVELNFISHAPRVTNILLLWCYFELNRHSSKIGQGIPDLRAHLIHVQRKVMTTSVVDNAVCNVLLRQVPVKWSLGAGCDDKCCSPLGVLRGSDSP